MGIAPYKYFTYDGKSSRDYDVYLTGDGVFNAPERAVEMLEIQGRNGDYALDQGKFKNITVTYKAGIVDASESNFANKVSAVRNWLCSKVGYKRLSDDYNPNEYRMAVYKSGVKIAHEDLRTGEFEITFECKPQRWLTSGEEAVKIGEWGETETVSGEVVEVEATEADAVKSLIADINPVQSGSGTPSPQNIRPISGHTDVDVVRTGKNLLDASGGSGTVSGVTFTNTNGVIVASNSATANVYRVVGTFTPENGVEYILTGCPSGGANGKYRITLGGYGYDFGSGYTFTGDGQSHNITCDVYTGYPTSGATLTFKPMIRLATETDNTWEKYNGTTCTTALGTTVYGGTLDVVSGELTVTHAIATIGSSSNIGWNSSGWFWWTSLTNKKYGQFNQIASFATQWNSTEALSNMPDGYMRGGISEATVYFKYNDYAGDVNGVKTALEGQTVCYELATPQTYQLTPQQIELLLGTNNIWADSGDVTVEYGQDPMALVNPTPFEAEPLLAVDGYGTIGFNGFEIEINNEVMGDVIVAEADDVYRPTTRTITIQADLLNTSDTFVVNAEFRIQHTKTSSNQVTGITLGTATGCSAVYSSPHTVNVVMDSATFTKGTSATATCSIVYSAVTTNTGTVSCTQTCTVTYNGTDTLTFSMSGTNITNTANKRTTMHGVIYGDSTISVLGNPTYIDCEIGECYMIKNSEIISLNQYIDLGSDLPKLSSGTNTFTYDNTVTELNVTPRWWKV